MKKFSFPKAEHLKSPADIQAVFRKGKKITCDGAKLFVLPNGMEQNRIVFTFPRKYGRAVDRNKSRRLSREVFRLVKPRIKTGFDMALLIFPGKDKFSEREFQIETLCRKAGLLEEGISPWE